jgi:hypothetical protein
VLTDTAFEDRSAENGVAPLGVRVFTGTNSSAASGVIFSSGNKVLNINFLFSTTIAKYNIYRSLMFFVKIFQWKENRRFMLRSLREFGFGKKTTEEIVIEEWFHFNTYLR